MEREQELAESMVPKQQDLVLQSRREQQGPNVLYEFM